MLNALTIDVEDFFQVTAFERQIRREDWPSFDPRVNRNTRRLLDLFDEHDVKATFYVLGWVAEKMPSLVREIADRGHEVGSHSYWHRLIYRMTPEEFRTDLVRSRKVIEDASGRRVDTFRAPSFSITRESLWAFQILGEEGFCSDSSVYPTRHDRYGIHGARQDIHTIATGDSQIHEFPMTVVRRSGVNVPVSGGGYFRLYPLSWTLGCLQRVNSENRPFVFYLHPWEIDPNQPRLKAASVFSRWRHYINLKSTEAKLIRLLKSFRFGRLSDVLQQAPSSGGHVERLDSLYGRRWKDRGATHAGRVSLGGQL